MAQTGAATSNLATPLCETSGQFHARRGESATGNPRAIQFARPPVETAFILAVSFCIVASFVYLAVRDMQNIPFMVVIYACPGILCWWGCVCGCCCHFAEIESWERRETYGFVAFRDHRMLPMAPLFIAFGAGLIPSNAAASLIELGATRLASLFAASIPSMAMTTSLSVYIWNGMRSFLVIAPAEESVKFIAVVLITKIYGTAGIPTAMQNQWIILHAQMVAAGFSTAENVLYIFLGPQRSIWWMFQMTLLRSSVNLPGHCIYLVISVARLTRNKYTEERLRGWQILGPAIFFHGCQDFVLSIFSRVISANPSNCHDENLPQANMTCHKLVTIHPGACQGA